MRLDKFLSNLKFGTRKEVSTYIRKKRVTVNGEIISKPETNVSPEIDQICFDDELIYYKEQITLLMNKPQGYVSANTDNLHQTVFDLIEEPYSRFDLNIAGRLDIDTEGLLVLTTDGTLLHQIITPSKNVYKTYYVEVKAPFDANKLLRKMELLDGNNRPFTPMTPIVEQLTETSFHLSIKEGKFHQIKRMVEHFNNEVTFLKRISIGDILLPEDLPLGGYIEYQKND